MRQHHFLVGSVVAAMLLTQAVAEPAMATTAAPLPAPTVTELGSTTVTVGGSANIQFSEPAGSDPVAEFVWTVTGESQYRVAAAGGTATVPVLAVRQFNALDVYARGTDGSFSPTTQFYFTAVEPAPAADQDLTGDGKPDLITAGGTPGLATGLWQLAGRGTKGQVETPAVNIGIDGNGVGSTFDGAQVITGKFFGGPFEDYLAYYPADGGALFFSGLGAATAQHPEIFPRSETSMPSGALSNDNGENPTQLVNAYDGSGNHGAIPDLLGIVGSADHGYGLYYYPNAFGAGGYGTVDAVTALTPTGGADWNDWRLASKLLPNGTAVVLWNQSTGALYLWEGVTFDANTGRLSYQQYHLARRWLRGAELSTLRLTDVNGDGVPDLWAVTPRGTVTAYVVTHLSATGTAKIEAGAPQRLS